MSKMNKAERNHSRAVLELHDICQSFWQGEREIEVLRGLNLSLAAGERVALLGQSGSGKSTLLQIAGLLSRPDSGSITLLGEDYSRASDTRQTRARRDAIGFVYQAHHLLPELSAEENVAMPQLIAGTPMAEAQARAQDLLGMMRLSHRLHHRPSELSGGEQQRVAIARALANRPALVLADEPTGNLDPETSDEVFAAFSEVAREAGTALLMVTHNHALAERLDRVVRLEQGALQA